MGKRVGRGKGGEEEGGGEGLHCRFSTAIEDNFVCRSLHSLSYFDT